MPLTDDPAEAGSPFRPRFQFSLWSMFVLTTALAIGMGFLVAAPFWLVILATGLLALALPMVLTIAVVYGRGRLRTFAIGALFPSGFLVICSGGMIGFPLYAMFNLGDVGDDPEARVILVGVVAVAVCLIGGFGLLALWVRRLVERPRRQPSIGPTQPTNPATEVPPPPGASERRPD